jgi:orotidine-5'-phosphate decarboxylase
MTKRRFANPVFVALDTPELSHALRLGADLRPHVGGLKIGLEFITANGPDGVRRVADLGLPVFADVKFHDIPNTVAGAARSIASLGVTIFNVHASGGAEMMRAGADAARAINPTIQVIGVTVLTSLDDDDLGAVGQSGPTAEQATRLAMLAHMSGLDGVVCAVSDLQRIGDACGRDFLKVVPGIRPLGSALKDQKRADTPIEACRAGADILVIGRPISAALDPVAAARAIAESLSATAA